MERELLSIGGRVVLCGLSTHDHQRSTIPAGTKHVLVDEEPTVTRVDPIEGPGPEREVLMAKLRLSSKRRLDRRDKVITCGLGDPVHGAAVSLQVTNV